MTTSIKLNQDVWTESGDVYVRGQAFRNGEYLDSVELREAVKIIDNIDELSSFFSSLNGFFSVVIDTNGETILAADRMRTGPVFYSLVDGELQVSDDCGWIMEQTPGLTRSKLSEIEYETSRFVTGSHTLYEEISQLQSGEIVVFDKASTDFSTYQHHIHTVTDSQYEETELQSEFQRVLDAAFERLVEVADGRPIVVPLSGGYDSRLIALMLKRVGYENVITYTVNLGQGDSSVARQISDALDYPWVTPKLTHSDWEEFYKSDQWDQYFNQAAYLGVLPGLVDILALEQLRENDELPTDALFVPGHSALDSMKATPKILEESDELQVDRLTKFIINQHFKYNDHLSISYSDFVDRVTTSIGIESPFPPRTPLEAFERWRLKERRAKLIINGVHAFDFLGLDWWLPLEDQEIYEFWRKVPTEHKHHRVFYENYIESLYTDISGKPGKEMTGSSNWKASVSNRFQGTLFWPVIRQSYNIWDGSRAKKTYIKNFYLEDFYKSDPRFGIMSWESLVENYDGQSYLFHSVLAQSITRDISMTGEDC